MAVNRVDYGGNTLIDLTGDTLESAEQLLAGVTAHGRDGNLIVGIATAAKRQQASITLPQSDWVDGQQTVSVPGVTADASVVVGGDVDSEPDYSDCGVYCSAQGDGTLTFAAAWIPGADMTANVFIFT